MKTNIIYHSNCVEQMKQFPEESIDLIVTSPPYDNLRNYKGYKFDYKAIIDELYRVTKKGGVVVWVIGDAVINGSETGSSFRQALYFKEVGFLIHDTMIYEKNSTPYPASVKGNRYSQIFEYMFVFSKGKPKTSNLIADKKNKWAGDTNWGKRKERQKNGELKEAKNIVVKKYGVRNNIWKYNTGAGYTTKDEIAFKHPAIFPEKLVADHIKTWSNKGDIVLDPMAGSGTTLKMAESLDRKWIGIDISKEYCEIARQRIEEFEYREKVKKENDLENFLK